MEKNSSGAIICLATKVHVYVVHTGCPRYVCKFRPPPLPQLLLLQWIEFNNSLCSQYLHDTWVFHGVTCGFILRKIVELALASELSKPLQKVAQNGRHFPPGKCKVAMKKERSVLKQPRTLRKPEDPEQNCGRTGEKVRALSHHFLNCVHIISQNLRFSLTYSYTKKPFRPYVKPLAP